MQACVDGGAIALLTATGGVIASCIGALFWQLLRAKDEHIRYLQETNADLTELNRAAVGIAGGAVKKVGASARGDTSGRRGS